jgi:hypothetical protein
VSGRNKKYSDSVFKELRSIVTGSGKKKIV